MGGFGTRLREYSETIPKPLVPVGPRPVVWYLMKYYAHFGHKDFILCLGYQGDLIRKFFLNYNEALATDFTMSPGGTIELLGPSICDWRITFLDTGLKSNVGQRLLAVRDYVKDEEVFLANYSDGLSDLPLPSIISRLTHSDAVAAFVTVRPSNSLSQVEADDNGFVRRIEYLRSSVLINGGFFVFRNKIFDYIRQGDELVEEPFARLMRERRLLAYRYDGFWSALDTFKDKKRFDDLYEQGVRPWEVWKDHERKSHIRLEDRDRAKTAVIKRVG